MSFWWIPISILIFLLVVLIIVNISIVRESRAYVVERLGSFCAVWTKGPHVKIPFIMRVVKKVSLVITG